MPETLCHCISRRLYYRSLISVSLQVVFWSIYEFTFVKRIRLFFDFFDPFDESGLEFVSSSKVSSSADGLRSKTFIW